MNQTYAIVAAKDLSLPQPGGPDRVYAKDQVINLVVWDGETAFDPGEDMKLVPVPPGWGVVDGKLAELPTPGPGEPPAVAHEVPKLLVVERLAEAGKLRAARAALKAGAPDDDLSDEELTLRDRWDAARVIASDDAQARGLFAAIGADPDVILAPVVP